MCAGAGPTVPVVPVSVIVTTSDNNNLTVQWEIPSISYTPETYHVEYGTQYTVLDSQSVGQDSGDDIKILGQIYSQELTDLQPLTTYYFRVVSTNLAGSTASIVRSVRTIECELAIKPLMTNV